MGDLGRPFKATIQACYILGVCLWAGVCVGERTMFDT
jgi:hypothetical protein